MGEVGIMLISTAAENSFGSSVYTVVVLSLLWLGTESKLLILSNLVRPEMHCIFA
jgi:hypothetical protein